nr:hypothetical protein [Tanacetum cinerariifolium]
METIIDQQVAMDEALVSHAHRLRIGRSNFRLLSNIKSKESTLQLVYDVLRLTPFFKAFLVTADVSKIYISNWKLPVCYDDDDEEESSNSLEDNIISELPSYSAVTPSEPVDSLSIGDEHLNTISATKSDEFIKSCVENLVPNPSESEGENECDVPAGFTTFSNVLFDVDYDFDSGDDQSTSDTDFPKKIYSNPLFDEEINPMKIDQHPFNAESDLIRSMPNHDSSIIISSKIDSLFDEFAGELTLLKLIPSRFDETDCHPEKETRFTKRLLYDNSSPRPPEEIVSDNANANIESFSPSLIPNEDSDSHMDEIDLPFTLDDPMSSDIEDDDYDSGRDIPILEELINNYSLSLPANESYHFDIPSPYRPPAKPPDGNTGTLNIKMMGDICDQKEKSLDLLTHQGFEAFQPSAECPMIINGKNIPLLDVRNKQEPDKIGTKPDQIKKKTGSVEKPGSVEDQLQSKHQKKEENTKSRDQI